MQQPNPFDDKTIRQALGSKSLDEIADWMASAKPDSQSIQIGQVEFSRRQTKAAEETAKHTKSNRPVAEVGCSCGRLDNSLKTPNFYLRLNCVFSMAYSFNSWEADFCNRSNAHYMMWSVIVIAITSILNALFAFLNWYVPHVPH